MNIGLRIGLLLATVTLGMQGVGAAQGVPAPGPTATVPQRDYWPTSGWRTATPAAVGMDSLLLRRAEWFYPNLFPSAYSLLVVRNGYIVSESYFDGVDARSTPHVFSITKTVMSALTGIAIQEGLITGVEQPVVDFFPDYLTDDIDPRAREVTVQHVLTHTSGLRRPEGTGDDWLRATLQAELAFDPGSEFAYSNVAPDLLSGIITRRSGMSTLDFARRRLFAPLGIEPGEWATTPTGLQQGANGLHLSARDLARLGFLYLNEGLWDGVTVLSPEWVRETRRRRERFDGTKGYGYLTWVWERPDTVGGRAVASYFAYGHRGQYIGVYPELDLLVVTSANADDATRDTYFVQNYIHDFVRLFIFPAIVGAN